jgi:hypothetical protein
LLSSYRHFCSWQNADRIISCANVERSFLVAFDIAQRLWKAQLVTYTET